MSFGVESKERRKTSHINEEFKKYNANSLSECLGFPVDGRTGITILKICIKNIVRFVMTLEEEDFDQYGERAVNIHSIGKFKVMNTIPQGRRLDLVGEDGKYPRFKFYPSAALEAEVEILNGIESEESRSVYERNVESEKNNMEQNVAEINKILKRSKTSPIFLNSLDDIVKNIIEKEIKKYMGKDYKEVKKELKEIDDENVEYGVELEELQESVIKKVKKEKKVKKIKEVKKEVSKIETLPEETLPEETLPESKEIVKGEVTNVSDTIDKALDDFDFDFNT